MAPVIFMEWKYRKVSHPVACICIRMHMYAFFSSVSSVRFMEIVFYHITHFIFFTVHHTDY